MQLSSVGALAPLALLIAAFMDWSLSSELFLLCFLFVQYKARWKGFYPYLNKATWRLILMLAIIVFMAQDIMLLIWVFKGRSWKANSSQWLNLLGLTRLNPWKSGFALCLSLLLQLGVITTVVAALHHEQTGYVSGICGASSSQGSWFCQILRNILLPVVQVIVGIARPCWISFPFFVCSCIGLLRLSMTTNSIGLSWGWRPLLLYAGLDILFFYSYQLPILYLQRLTKGADYMGLFKMSHGFPGWLEAVQGISLLVFYTLLCTLFRDGEDSDDFASQSTTLPTSHTFGSYGDDGCLQETLLPSRLSSQVGRESTQVSPMKLFRPYCSWKYSQFNNGALQIFTINFFVYGYPVCLFLLVLWSFKYASLCAFILIFYAGYTLYAFPSLRLLSRLNTGLLVFIIFWALSTYIFNAAFSSFQDQAGGVWDTIGLWHYSTPGFFLLVQFVLSVMIAANIYACSVVLANIRVWDVQTCSNDNAVDEEQHSTKILAFAIAVWLLSRSGHVISLILIFLVGLQHGLVSAIYMLFFILGLLRSSILMKARPHLMILCGIHFTILYFLQLESIATNVERQSTPFMSILSILGISSKADAWDFAKISILFAFTAIAKQGFKLLLSLMAIVQGSRHTLVGAGFLKVPSNRCIILSLCISHDYEHLQHTRNIAGHWTLKQLLVIEEAIYTICHSVGSYIAYLTILMVVYITGANYVSFGYFTLLLFWIVGRQLLGKTHIYLWFPLLLYAAMVFFFRFIFSCFPDLQRVFSGHISLFNDLGLDFNASIIGQLLDSLVVLVVMQLFMYERTHQFNESNLTDQMGYMGLLKRFLILHSGKILSIAVFYAGISPVSGMGFMYMLMVIFMINVSKTSRLPARIHALYSAITAAAEFLFLILGERMELFPGKSYGSLTYWLGFRVAEKNFWGMELVFRGRALVLASCLLQYSAFSWLEHLPISLQKNRPGEEPCFLFLPFSLEGHKGNEKGSRRKFLLDPLYHNHQTAGLEGLQIETVSPMSSEYDDIAKNYKLGVEPTFSSHSGNSTMSNHFAKSIEVVCEAQNSLLNSSGLRQSRQWSKRITHALRKERYDGQLRALNVLVKHVIENFFHLYGLEISMFILLMASFAVLNAISLIYIVILGLCVLLERRRLRYLWPFFVALFAIVLLIEYVALGRRLSSWIAENKENINLHCHVCWKNSSENRDYCWCCWLGFVVDDRQMLVAYFMVFMFFCFKLRSDFLSSQMECHPFRALALQIDKIIWKDIAYETKGQWTWLDHLRFFYYRHLLDIMLILVLITGTLQYDVLHLGYLSFALMSFRRRATILKQGSCIFWLLRFYNFLLISLSLIYQAPLFPYLGNGSCKMPEYLYEIVGLLKFAYGFDITSRSALIDITIFCGVGLQSSIFQSNEFEQVLRYLEAEEVDVKLHAQEKKAAWKTEQLQHVREMEERKHQRRKQVEKMKIEMLHLQSNMRFTNSPEGLSDSCSSSKGSARLPAGDTFLTIDKPDYFPSTVIQERFKSDIDTINNEGRNINRRRHQTYTSIPGIDAIKDNVLSVEKGNDQHFELAPERDVQRISLSGKASNLNDSQKCTVDPSTSNIHHVNASSDRVIVRKSKSLECRRPSEPQRVQSLRSGVQLLGDSVAQVQTFGNKALANIVGLLNIDQNDSNDTEESAADETKHQSTKKILSSRSNMQAGEGSSHSMSQKKAFKEMVHRLRMIFNYGLSRIRSNVDAVCYFFFLIVYLWNYSLLTLVYPAALFLYALLLNPGPTHRFWVAILVYTELIILLQYIYQISVNHCDHIHLPSWLQFWLKRFGIPATNIIHPFVISYLPLFLVYFMTLLQSSIKSRDGEWMSFSDRWVFPYRRLYCTTNTENQLSFLERIRRILDHTKQKYMGIWRGMARYLRSLIYGSEAPPHFVQVSMHVNAWPEDGIQPERIESGFNKLLAVAHNRVCRIDPYPIGLSSSRVRVESIDASQNKNIVTAVLEVIYAAPTMQCPSGPQYSSLTPAADVALEIQRAKDDGLPEELEFPYPIFSVIAGGKREIDLYAYTFGTDLIAFAIAALFYQSVMKNSSELLQIYQLEDQFPKEYVFVLMTLFFLIILDRIIYLCSCALGKVVYYYFNLGLFTYYATNYAWQLESNHPGSGLLVLRAFFLMKALSFCLQALQIKYGLPEKSSLFRQFLTRKVTQTNYIGFRLYRSLPFLFELRCILDWSCTATALTMYDWLKLEDIYASLFLVQCDAKLTRNKHQMGTKQGVCTKFLSGVCLFLALICVIWAPMLMYSSGNPTNIANPVSDVQMQIDITTTGGRFSLYRTSLCQAISMADAIAGGFNLDPILNPYDIQDEQLVCCQEDADSLWLVPPPTLGNLINSVDGDLIIISKWTFIRQRPKEKEVVTFTNQTSQPDGIDLQEVLKGNAKSVQIKSLYPRYFQITSTGEVRKLEGTDNYVSGNLTMNHVSHSWWSFTRHEASSEDGCSSLKGPIAIIISEEVPQGLIGETLSKFSITSLYITFVLALGRFIRLQCADLRMRIPYENLPSCDRLLAICEDIYVARAARELALEDGLFWTLVEIYRSPHVLLEYTKDDCID